MLCVGRQLEQRGGVLWGAGLERRGCGAAPVSVQAGFGGGCCYFPFSLISCAWW